MILEVAILDVVAGQESEFEAAFADAQRYLRSIDGYLSPLRRGVQSLHLVGAMAQTGRSYRGLS